VEMEVEQSSIDSASAAQQDDSALFYSGFNYEGALPGTIGLTDAQLEESRATEILMRARDTEIKVLLATRNDLEAYLLELRGAPNRKHGTEREVSVVLECK